MKPCSHLCLLCLFSITVVSFDAVYANERNTVSLANSKVSLKNELRSLTISKDTSARYLVSLSQLGSNREYTIVYLMGRFWCGSAGCRILVLDRFGKS